ncbi:MAG: FAD-dependent monooxygenase [Acidobacteria bacterium]|nr:FAD-dependent monooxygenase [Acidobacteriota bacterium]
MFGKNKVDTLVVGAGPVGLFAGAALAHRGFETMIVDSQWRTASRSYALALHPRTIDLLHQVGLGGEIEESGNRIDTLAFFEGGKRVGELRYGDLPAAHPYLLILPQEAMERMLEARLKAAGVKVLWNHRLASFEVEGDRVRAQVDRLIKESSGYGFAETSWVVGRSLDIRAHWLLGADGSRSLVRRQLGIGFEEVAASDLFAVFEFDTAGLAIPEVRVILDEGAMGVLWPLGGGRYRWSFQVESISDPEREREKSRVAVVVDDRQFPHLGVEQLKRLIRERAPWFEAQLGEIRWSLGVRFERRLAESFARPPLWLVGDSAHLAGPLGMHSMNVGIAEAASLIEALAGHREDGLELPLEHWAEERQKEWRKLLGLGAPPAARPDAAAWAAKRASLLPGWIPASGPDLEGLLGQVGVSL